VILPAPVHHAGRIAVVLGTAASTSRTGRSNGPAQIVGLGGLARGWLGDFTWGAMPALASRDFGRPWPVHGDVSCRACRGYPQETVRGTSGSTGLGPVSGWRESSQPSPARKPARPDVRGWVAWRLTMIGAIPGGLFGTSFWLTHQGAARASRTITRGGSCNETQRSPTPAGLGSAAAIGVVHDHRLAAGSCWAIVLSKKWRERGRSGMISRRRKGCA